jgi:hypothetical protein
MRTRLLPGVLLLAVSAATSVTHAQDPDDAGTPAGRDFPKTLTLDEPGIDDEMSLPTVSRIRHGGGAQTALAVEIDKRITDRLDVQVNGGWQSDAAGDGWQDFELTTKYVALSRPATETLLTVGITRLFGHSGALRIGAAPVGGTTLPAAGRSRAASRPRGAGFRWWPAWPCYRWPRCPPCQSTAGMDARSTLLAEPCRSIHSAWACPHSASSDAEDAPRWSSVSASWLK